MPDRSRFGPRVYICKYNLGKNYSDELASKIRLEKDEVNSELLFYLDVELNKEVWCESCEKK